MEMSNQSEKHNAHMTHADDSMDECGLKLESMQSDVI